MRCAVHRSQQWRERSEINTGAKPFRIDVATVLGWLKISAKRMSLKLSSINCSADTPPAIRFNTKSLDLFAIRSLSNRSSKHSTRKSSLDRITSDLSGALLGASRQGPTTSVSLNQCPRHCHQVAHRKTIGIGCGGADDEDVPPCVTGVDDVCDVETVSRVFGKSHLFPLSFCIRDCT